MPQFDSEGKFVVKITEANIRTCPKEGAEEAFMLNMRGETSDGYHGWGSLYFSNKTITGGRNAGLTCAQSSIDTLQKIGVKDGYIGNLQEAILNDLVCQFATKWDEYQGTKSCKVAFINPVTTSTPIAEVDYTALMAKFEGVATPTHVEVVDDIPDDFKAVDAPVAPAAPAQDLPF